MYQQATIKKEDTTEHTGHRTKIERKLVRDHEIERRKEKRNEDE
jgi:hypothetical protein